MSNIISLYLETFMSSLSAQYQVQVHDHFHDKENHVKKIIKRDKQTRNK